MHTQIDPKLQKMSKVQVPIMILHEGVHKKNSRGFRRVSEKLHRLYFDQVNSKKNLMYMEIREKKTTIQ